MPHIFISYASEDRPIAQALAEALQAEGWTIWWDRKIPVGKSFHEVIEDAIDAARCVLVIWTDTSVESDWVRNEADEGSRRNILVPVRMGEVRIPLGFRHLQAADLHDWKPGVAHPEYDSLRESIRGVFDQSEPGVKMEARAPDQPSVRREHVAGGSGQPDPGHRPGAIGRTGEERKSWSSVDDSPAGSGARRSRKKEWIAAGVAVVFIVAAIISTIEEGSWEEEPVVNAEFGLGSPLDQEIMSDFVGAASDDAPLSGSNSRMSLQWQDHAVRFDGTLTHSGGAQGQIQATLYDLNTGAQLGNQTFSVQLQAPAMGQYVIRGDVVIPNGDSATPGRHTHPVFIQVQHYANGNVAAQNCTVQGCFAATVSQSGDY